MRSWRMASYSSVAWITFYPSDWPFARQAAALSTASVLQMRSIAVGKLVCSKVSKASSGWKVSCWSAGYWAHPQKTEWNFSRLLGELCTARAADEGDRDRSWKNQKWPLTTEISRLCARHPALHGDLRGGKKAHVTHSGSLVVVQWLFACCQCRLQAQALSCSSTAVPGSIWAGSG